MRTFWPGGLGSNFTLRRRISLFHNAYVTRESPHVQEIRHREIKQGHQQYTAEDNAEFERALTEEGVEHELVTYDGAPHSFFDRSYEEFAEASADAWRRTLAFIDAH